MKDLHEEFQKEVRSSITKIGDDAKFQELSLEWMRKSIELRYSYNFSSLGRPIIQYPTDIVVTQELIWKVKPDLIIDCGIAHGGSAILNASCLALLDYCDAINNNLTLDPKKTQRKVLALDIDIREHQKEKIMNHPMSNHIEMFEGSSIAKDIIQKVYEYAKNFKNVMVCLDSDHTHSHVLGELKAYAPLVSKNSYCIVWDGIIEHLPEDAHTNRSWMPGNNPYTALHEYLGLLKSEPQNGMDGESLNFEIDKTTQDKISITVAPDGFLKRI